MRPSLLFLALSLSLPQVAHAQAAESAPDGADAPAEFDRIVVTATRSERAIADVPNTVDVIERERMDDLLVRDLRDLFRYEPGITVTRGFGRFGIGDIRIRGLGGNRVRIQVDGIPVADAFDIGSFADANRNFVDLDTLERVEVVRGPTSALYGSDALGGTVAFVTKDPQDYLGEGKNAYFGLKLGFESDWEGLFGGATAAFGGARWSGLVALSHRQGKETENQGENPGEDDPSTPNFVENNNRTLPNPQRRDGRSLLSKLVYAPDADRRFRLTAEGNEDRADTEVLTARTTTVSPFPPFARTTVNLQNGSDLQTRARVSFAHEMDALTLAFADGLDWQVYRQDSETTQRTVEQRTLATGRAPPLRDRREREFNFDQRLHGVQLNLRKAFATGGARHTLSYGFEIERTDTRQKRDGRRIFLDTGAVTPVVSPDTFPVRDFPISRTTEAGLYVQDEIEFAGGAPGEGAFRLIPSLRADYYALEPELDPIFAEDNPGVAVSRLRERNLSPKLGAVWKFAPAWSLFAGYARGFRSPPYNDVNIGFTNLQFGYTAIANPDLKPETSDGFEAGLRFVDEAAYFGLTAYYNRYDDFIESLALVSAPPQTPLLVFQSRNVAQARIYGAELKGGVQLGALSPRLMGWSLRGAAAYARGDDCTEDVPLDSVDPLTATLGLAYEAEVWGAELAGRFVDGKRRVSDPTLYVQPGFGVLDLYAHWAFAPGAKLNLGVFNLADREYLEAGDLPPVPADSTTLDRYTAPGRSLALSVAVEW